jgi:hypothetical protein
MAVDAAFASSPLAGLSVKRGVPAPEPGVAHSQHGDCEVVRESR